MVENLKFRAAHKDFRNTLKQDMKKINTSTKVLTFADKTRNVYQLDKNNTRNYIEKTSQRTTRKLMKAQ